MKRLHRYTRQTAATLLCASLALASQVTQALEIHSPGLPEGATLPDAQVFKGFGCEGQNQSPALNWSDAPAGTKSFAITIYDPDAPTGSGWWHWVVFNIPANTHTLPAGAGTADTAALPPGTLQSRTDFGTPGFGGACPPPGATPHRYQLTLFALDVESLPLDTHASGALVGFMLNQHALEKARITWRYGR
ncbi:MAG: YbhB/YbcL family Raf kinase inhibitor-like protein [Hahellaceae bacterium]|nr:YbhB/YbcL family Raf kinase inhibitor-like protein [Hahellaceae bacterium]